MSSPSTISQGLGEEILPDGSVRRFFFDHFGDDFDAYICRAADMEQAWEDPRDVEQMFRTLMKGDKQRKRHHRFVTLVDLSSDGRAYYKR